ncbi:MAG: hypothetical protein JNL32_11245 [Candidatus Kapabacteria bacterium]|nr:hypothetical protein [Candidatus Kapabacteria bacterium]
MQRPQHYSARLLEKRFLNERETYLHVQFNCTPLNPDLPQYPGHTPGQYATFLLSEQDRRSYSFASVYSGDSTVDFVVEILENGIGSHRMATMEIGDTIEGIMPYGRFTYQNDETIRHHVVIGTGSGIVPLKPILEYGLQISTEQRFTLVWGLRYESDLFWVDEFRRLEEQYRQFRAMITITKPTETWQGLTGRVTEHLPALLTEVADTCVYLCGGHAMIHDARTLAGDCGIEKKRIITEQFY